MSNVTHLGVRETVFSLCTQNLPAFHHFHSFIAPILHTQTCHTLNLSQMHSASGSSEGGHLFHKGGELVAGSLVTAPVSRDLTNKELRCRSASLGQDQDQRQWSGSDRPEMKQADGKPGSPASGSGSRWRPDADTSAYTAVNLSITAAPQGQEGQALTSSLLYNSSYYWRSWPWAQTAKHNSAN